MIVWSGRGILIVLVFVVCALLGIQIFPEGMPGYVFAFAGLLSAIFSWLAGTAWNTGKKDRIVTDDRTGQKILLRSGRHGLFWIPMQYWGIILAVLSIIILAQDSILLAVAVAVLLCAVIAITYKMNRSKSIQPETTVSSVPEARPEITKEQEEEVLPQKVDKEDHSRFMPR